MCFVDIAQHGGGRDKGKEGSLGGERESERIDTSFSRKYIFAFTR